MKQLTFLTKIFFLFLALSFWTSCEEDGTGGGGITLPPAGGLQSGTGLVTSATTVDPGSTFSVNFVASKGDNDMTTFTVLEDGIAVDAGRLNYNGAGVGAFSNPLSLTAAEATTFDTNIEITAHTDGGTRTYTFRISDSAGETDDSSVDITVVSTPLAIGFGSGNGGLTSDVTLPGQTSFKVEVNATQGGSPLSTFAVYQDGNLVEASRVRFGTENDIATATVATSNPIDLIGDEKTGINWFVWVSSHDDGTAEYTYEVKDENGDAETLTLAITIQTVNVVELTGKLLLNAGGPVGTGGINLLTGDGTGSMDSDSHLRDLGIDNSMPTDQNWIQKIAPVNGSVLVVPTMDSPVNDFASVTNTADISSAYDAGTQISESSTVNIGDVFVVRVASGETVLISVTDIVETDDNNEDYYQLSIKY